MHIAYGSKAISMITCPRDCKAKIQGDKVESIFYTIRELHETHFLMLYDVAIRDDIGSQIRGRIESTKSQVDENSTEQR